MKFDVTNRSHDETSVPPRSRLKDLLITLSGVPADFAHKYGSQQERSDLMAAGAILFGSSALSSATAIAGFHLALGDGHFNPLYMAAGLGIGALTGAIDYVVQYKGTLNERGLAALRRAGLKLPDAETSKTGPRLIRVGRVFQAATFGFLGGLFFFIAGNAGDIRAYLDYKYMTANKAVAVDASRLADASIGRSKVALSQEDGEVANLGRSIQALRSNDVRRNIGRRANAPVTASNPQLEALELRLVEATAKRDVLAASVSAQETGRNAAIEKIIDESPNAVRRRTGLSADVEALNSLSNENSRLLIIFLAIEFLSLCLELGPLWAASAKIPSTLAARIALDHFIEVSKLAKIGAEKLGARGIDDTETVEPTGMSPGNDNMQFDMFAGDAPMPNDNKEPHAGLNGSAPRRRRSRKNTPDVNVEESGHE